MKLQNNIHNIVIILMKQIVQIQMVVLGMVINVHSLLVVLHM